MIVQGGTSFGIAFAMFFSNHGEEFILVGVSFGFLFLGHFFVIKYIYNRACLCYIWDFLSFLLSSNNIVNLAIIFIMSYMLISYLSFLCV